MAARKRKKRPTGNKARPRPPYTLSVAGTRCYHYCSVEQNRIALAVCASRARRARPGETCYGCEAWIYHIMSLDPDKAGDGGGV